MLIPFWGTNHSHDGYARFERDGKDFLQLTAPENADVEVDGVLRHFELNPVEIGAGETATHVQHFRSRQLDLPRRSQGRSQG